jgi:hypothetical protein
MLSTAAQKTWFERARQGLSNLVVFLLPFVRREGSLFTHLNQRFYRLPSFPLGFALAGRAQSKVLKWAK